MTLTLAAAQEAMQRHSWQEALEALVAADRSEGLSPDELQLMAQAAWWSGRPDDAAEAFERAYAGYSEAGQRSAAAGVALRLGEMAMRRVSYSIGAGWLARAERLLEGEPESAVHGWLRVLRAAHALYSLRDLDRAIGFADEAMELGRRHGSTDVESMALAFKGQALVMKGQWSDGLALFDEATATAVSGALDPKTACDVYCLTIAGCRSLADYRRAGEWTEEADRWMERNSVRGYRGACRLHRAELKRLRGEWTVAEEEVKNACAELEEFHLLDVLGDAHYELGELRLRMGDLAGAEQAFRRASEVGRNPEPGLALLLLERGELEQATSSILSSVADLRSSGDDGAGDRLARSRLLPAVVEISLAGSNLGRARSAVEELAEAVSTFESPALEATLLTARGSVELAEGDVPAAISTLNGAWRRWLEIDVPYEAARTRLLLGRARIAAGDSVSGRLDIESAQASFERLGAAPDLRRVTALLQGDSPTGEASRRRERMTFMFTDIVTSTDLAGLIGDEAWEALLRWHDRTLRAAIVGHRGEEVRHTGDGFFVAFRRAGDAIDCAVDIQRALADHRRQHGFALGVRIGLHAADATRKGDDFAGHGVHLAARVAALAEGDEILVSRATLDDADQVGLRLDEPRMVELKGIRDEVEVVPVDWR